MLLRFCARLPKWALRHARRYGEKMAKMVRGSEATHEELFSYACPKFVTCAPPNMDTPTANTNQACLVCLGCQAVTREIKQTITQKTTGSMIGSAWR